MFRDYGDNTKLRETLCVVRIFCWEMLVKKNKYFWPLSPIKKTQVCIHIAVILIIYI